MCSVFRLCKKRRALHMFDQPLHQPPQRAPRCAPMPAPGMVGARQYISDRACRGAGSTPRGTLAVERARAPSDPRTRQRTAKVVVMVADGVGPPIEDGEAVPRRKAQRGPAPEGEVAGRLAGGRARRAARAPRSARKRRAPRPHPPSELGYNSASTGRRTLHSDLYTFHYTYVYSLHSSYSHMRCVTPRTHTHGSPSVTTARRQLCGSRSVSLPGCPCRLFSVRSTASGQEVAQWLHNGGVMRAKRHHPGRWFHGIGMANEEVGREAQRPAGIVLNSLTHQFVLLYRRDVPVRRVVPDGCIHDGRTHDVYLVHPAPLHAPQTVLLAKVAMGIAFAISRICPPADHFASSRIVANEYNARIHDGAVTRRWLRACGRWAVASTAAFARKAVVAVAKRAVTCQQHANRRHRRSKKAQEFVFNGEPWLINHSVAVRVHDPGAPTWAAVAFCSWPAASPRTASPCPPLC